MVDMKAEMLQAEVTRLRTIIRTGGRMLREERCSMGIADDAGNEPSGVERIVKLAGELDGVPQVEEATVSFKKTKLTNKWVASIRKHESGTFSTVAMAELNLLQLVTDSLRKRVAHDEARLAAARRALGDEPTSEMNESTP